MSSVGTPPSLASIHVYPLKGGRAVDLQESQVEPWGLAGDRRWLVVDDAGRFISQRQEPALPRVVARYMAAPGPDHASRSPCGPGEHLARSPCGAGEYLAVSAAGRPPISVPAPSQDGGAEMLLVAVWSSKVYAAAAGKEADEWFSDFLDRRA